MTTSINTASLNPNMTSRKTISGSAIKTNHAATPVRTLRRLSRKWDMYGVIVLMASSAAYGMFALAHVA